MRVLDYLDEHYDFYNKNTIVITGDSSGGLATFFWSNYAFERTKTSKVYGIPDSGIFIAEYVSPIYNASAIRYIAT